jgi:hypothetical protein
VALALSVLSLKVLPMPFLWLDLVWTAGFFAGIFCLEDAWLRAILFNFSVVAAILAAGEAYFSLKQSAAPVYSEGYRVEDPILGYAPAKGIQAHSARALPEGLLYNVTYTIDSTGLRVSPPRRKDSLGSILFFGCSFTFGEGLQDGETLPYQVGVESEGQYRTYNFGFHGYGPHQMLAEIEHGLVERIVESDPYPRYAIYTMVPHHVARVAGRVVYGRHAPRYLLDSDGGVRQVGHFDDNEPKSARLDPALSWQLRKSAIYRMIENRDAAVSEDDIRLLFAVVGRSRDLLSAKYPGIEFHVMLWPYHFESEKPIYRKLKDGLGRMGIHLHVVEDILPGYHADPPKYLLSEADGHPNVLANRTLAKYVLTKIVSPPPVAVASEPGAGSSRFGANQK